MARGIIALIFKQLLWMFPEAFWKNQAIDHVYDELHSNGSKVIEAVNENKPELARELFLHTKELSQESLQSWMKSTIS